MQAADKERRDRLRGHPRRQDLPRHDPDASRRHAAKVKDLLTNRLDKTVFVKADARARYERVVDVVDNLRAAGVDQVGLLTEQIRRTRTRKPTAPAATPAGAVSVEAYLKEQSYGNGSRRTGGPKADINMTPMIDVLLVLIIIFMVITPLDAERPGGAGAAAAASEPQQQNTVRSHRGHHHR